MQLKLKDKRVDKILASKNHSEAEIFYSPISSWITVLALLVPSCAFILFSASVWKYWYLVVLYFIISYLIHAFLNNSFALYGDKLFIINPNFPFKRFKIFERAKIKLVTIDNAKIPWFLIFMAFDSYFLSIDTFNSKNKFYCAGLDIDAYDESWTEKTLDDLHLKLVENKFPVKFNIGC